MWSYHSVNKHIYIKYVYYLDPAPKVQDSVYGGLKIETPEKLLNSMLTCEEPNYAW